MLYLTYEQIFSMNTKSEDLKLAKILLKEYQAKKDKVNIKICLRNIKKLEDII